MPATITDLAARLKLSKGTVSRILNHKGAAFSEDTRKRVFAMAEEIGYTANPVARALATGRTEFVALYLSDLLTSYHAQVAHLMEEHLERHGYQVVVTLYGGQSRSSVNPVRAAPIGVDGIIAHENRGIVLPTNSRRPTPLVSTGVYYDQTSPDFVGIDLSDVAIEAVRGLVATGRKRIACLAHNVQFQHGDPRHQAYLRVMEESGLQTEFIDPPNENRPTVRATIREYIAAHGHPEALFCHNDDMAIAAYRGLSDIGLRVPEDVALLGCDGIDDTAYFPSAISTIAQPFEEMCETAWRFLERRLAEPDAPPQQVILQPRLLWRESTG
jgi:LacI family transcriptional regulator